MFKSLQRVKVVASTCKKSGPRIGSIGYSYAVGQPAVSKHTLPCVVQPIHVFFCQYGNEQKSRCEGKTVLNCLKFGESAAKQKHTLSAKTIPATTHMTKVILVPAEPTNLTTAPIDEQLCWVRSVVHSGETDQLQKLVHGQRNGDLPFSEEDVRKLVVLMHTKPSVLRPLLKNPENIRDWVRVITAFKTIRPHNDKKHVSHVALMLKKYLAIHADWAVGKAARDLASIMFFDCQLDNVVDTCTSIQIPGKAYSPTETVINKAKELRNDLLAMASA